MSPRSPVSVSVVVPTRNRPDRLARALRSIAAQTHAPAEVVVVDDGSTPPVRRDIWDGPGRLVLVRREDKLSEGAARNAGMAEVQSPWVAWCDDDDRWAPWKLRVQLEALAAFPQARWSVGAAAMVDTDGQVLGHRGVGEFQRTGASVVRLLLSSNSLPAPMSSLIVRTDTIRAIGGFDDGLPLFADWDLLIRLAADGPPAVVSRTLAVLERHGGQMTANLDAGALVIAELRRRYAALRGAHGVHAGDDRVVLWLIGRQLHQSPAGAWATARTVPPIAAPFDVARLVRTVARAGRARAADRRAGRFARSDVAAILALESAAPSQRRASG